MNEARKAFVPQCEVCGEWIAGFTPGAVTRARDMLYWRDNLSICNDCRLASETPKCTDADVGYRNTLRKHYGVTT